MDDFQTLITLHNFSGTDGDTPNSVVECSVTVGGVLKTYLCGTTLARGANSEGTIFAQDITGGVTNGQFTILHSFTGSDGASPNKILFVSSTSTLYGTTLSGGTGNQGTLFSQDLMGNPLVSLVSFTGVNGSSPNGLVLGKEAGTFLGTTAAGGTNGTGTFFGYYPPGTDPLRSGLITFHSFSALTSGTNADGAIPTSIVLGDPNGTGAFITCKAGGQNGTGTFETSIPTTPLVCDPSTPSSLSIPMAPTPWELRPSQE